LNLIFYSSTVTANTCVLYSQLFSFGEASLPKPLRTPPLHITEERTVHSTTHKHCDCSLTELRQTPKVPHKFHHQRRCWRQLTSH